MKNLKYYGDKIYDFKDMPQQLANTLVEMTKDYGELIDEQLPLERRRMDFFIEHKGLDKEKPISDKMLDALWMKNGDGVLERRMSMYKKGLEKMMSNLKAILREKEQESRNQF
jgi:hypothetical protein